MGDQQIVDRLEQVWRSIAKLCETFTERDWKTKTDCPGWSVQDQLSHLSGTESRLLGRPRPDHEPSDLSHVRNEMGARNEVQVDWRRSWPGAKVLDEFKTVTDERLNILRAMGPDDFEAKSMTPLGRGNVREMLQIRVVDCWVHEQDIRRAVRRPGHLDGPVAEHSMQRLTTAMPYVVAKKAEAPDGVTVVFDVSGPVGHVVPVGVEGGRGAELESPPPFPDVGIAIDVETFVRLACGRWEADEALASGKVEITGDRSLGEAVVRQMNFMI